MHNQLLTITDRIKLRSEQTRAAYLDLMARQEQQCPPSEGHSCGNQAHTVAGVNEVDKSSILYQKQPNLGIVSAYNDMLSAHKPYEDYPQKIRAYAREIGATAQVSGGVPAMCDGVTQGQVGMQLSLFSRDVIAMATAVSLSHNTYQGIICLGICDKIVPGLLIGALQFGHLPGLFMPAGPMSTGQSNKDKARTRQAFAIGEASRDELLESECKSYHGHGTCTFYGTANSNQMLLEIMGLQLPSSSFVHPYGTERDSFNAKAMRVLVSGINAGKANRLCDIIDERSIFNGLVGLLATGGSTNHAIHLVAIAKAAGIIINWQDLSELSDIVPMICKIYPNGSEDVNAFHEAGGMAFVMHELARVGLLHTDVKTVMGDGLDIYCKTAEMAASDLIASSGSSWKSAPDIQWSSPAASSNNENVIRAPEEAFINKGGLTLLTGNIGRAIIKSSSVRDHHKVIEAPAKVFRHQSDFMAAYQRGELEQDFIAVLRFQGPKTAGMPELHQLTPNLGALLDKGYKVGLVTDGRMSGASGKVPAAIHLVPEAADGGNIARIHDGDLIRLDCDAGTLEILIDADELAKRDAAVDTEAPVDELGQTLFKSFRAQCSTAEEGATIF
ncbi:MAG: phosphogluconate dehydratase [Gammaproteobacteria bacterium]